MRWAGGGNGGGLDGGNFINDHIVAENNVLFSSDARKQQGGYDFPRVATTFSTRRYVLGVHDHKNAPGCMDIDTFL